MRKRLYRLAVLSLVLYLSASLVAGVILAEVRLHPARVIASAAEFSSAASQVSILRPEGVWLSAWTVRSATPNGDVVLLMHGLDENRAAMIRQALFLLVSGYSVLMPDARAHGESGGDLATFGLREAADVSAWVDWIELHYHPPCVFAFGESMGAAQLLQSLAQETRFCAVAADSPFANFREATFDYLGAPVYAGPLLARSLFRPVVEFGFLYTRLWHGLDLTHAAPDQVVGKTRVPILLIHGKEDPVLPVSHSIRLITANPNIDLWEVPQAGHCQAIAVDPAEFQHRLLTWFGFHSRSPDERISFSSPARNLAY